ncbi:hypothetical protein MLD38_010138 [Melastoma candidum]|uniref:Uncharacterized protein n=2 Tax=Melastoma candidum TaxID=119954 RepID=A0ACB9QY85_9MYRT|nr:hypothetical protein MLD38_010128 [Melastoma candidum]KAI4371836.1 hypothetical protein MLD38_010138 [Melastoma candidum]
MPRPSSLIPRGPFLSEVARCLPAEWTEVRKQVGVTITRNDFDKPMIDSALRTLEDFVSRGKLLSAFRTFSLVQLLSLSGRQDVLPQSLSSLLRSCSNLMMSLPGKQIHARIVLLGLAKHPALVRSLVRFYSSLDLMDDAYILASSSDTIRTSVWNIVLSAHVRNGNYNVIISMYKEMMGKGYVPDNFTYTSILTACGEEKDMELGQEVHRAIDASHFQQNLFVQNSLITMYGRFGMVDFARKLFDHMLEKDVVSWNSMVSVYASHGRWEEAMELFQRMLENGVEFNLVTSNMIASGYAKMGDCIGALKLISQIRLEVDRLDPIAMITGLAACANIGNVILGKEIHGTAIRCFYHLFDNVRNALITMYSRCKSLKDASTLFEAVELKSLTTWNSMLSGYCRMDQTEEASRLFREMLLSGPEPNFVTIASILPLCARVANLQHGKEFHGYLMKRDQFDEHLLLWNALVDMYARSGKVSQAKKVFDLMKKRDAVTYTSLIVGYGMQGDGQIALEHFREMVRAKIMPDHIAMVAILTACSHSGLVVQGEKLFHEMMHVYQISPHIEHYACVADMYGRAGLLNRARSTIVQMPFPPTQEMWATLLGACRIHRNTEIGEWAAGKLLEMRPDNSGYYALIANTFASAGCWDKLATVRSLMRDVGVKKAPGCAWLDIGIGFAPFVVEDSSNRHTQEMYSMLETLADVMKNAPHNDSDETETGDEYMDENICDL